MLDSRVCVRLGEQHLATPAWPPRCPKGKRRMGHSQISAMAKARTKCTERLHPMARELCLWPDFRVGKSYYNLPSKNPGAKFVMKNRTILGSAFSEAHISEARTQLQRSFELGNWAGEVSMMIVCLGLCDVGLGL